MDQHTQQYYLDAWKLPEEVKEQLTAQRTRGKYVRARMPGRVDLAGGWTDTPPYPFSHEAAVLNTSLTFSNQWLIDVSVERAEEFSFYENGLEYVSPHNHIVLVNVLRYLEMDFDRMMIRSRNAIPHGSGLGGSSLYAAALLSAISAHYVGAEWVVENPGFIVNGVLMIEQMMGSGGGWQDQIGGIFPGIKLIETSPDVPHEYRISYIEDQVADLLSDYSLIVDSGIGRRAANVLAPIRQMAIDNDRGALQMLAGIRRIAKCSLPILKRGEIHTFAPMMSQAWNSVVEVETKVTVEEMVRRLEDLVGADLIGRKIAGAGGGGFMILVFSSRAMRDKYEITIQDALPKASVYRPIFGRYGMAILQGGKNHRVARKERV